MTRWAAVTANVEAAGTAEAAALLGPLLEAIGEPVTELREPESYAWKIPGTWMATAVLALQDGDDALGVVTGLTARLPLPGWHLDGDEDIADGVWDAGDARTTPFPGITWVLVQAAHPRDPDAEPPHTGELVPDPPQGELDPDLLRYLQAADRPGQARYQATDRSGTATGEAEGRPGQAEDQAEGRPGQDRSGGEK